MKAAERSAPEIAISASEWRALVARAEAPWLEPFRERLGILQARGRLPHGLLFTGAAGSGQAPAAAWLAARLLCHAPDGGACGRCADCRLVAAANHPDLLWVRVQEDKKEISIDQVRGLADTIHMRSYRGGAKVAVIAAAEAMNVKSWNALLKTLEEPSSDSYLVLGTSRVDRLPATIVSRCQRYRLPLPGAEEALRWLTAAATREDWPSLLALAGGSPFLAQDYAQKGLGELDREMQSLVAAAGSPQFDLVGAAEACARAAPAARLAWLESWLTRQLRDALLAGEPVNNNRLPWSGPPAADLKIRAAFGVLDQVRDARRRVDGPLNTQLLFEELLVALVDWIGRRPCGKGEGSG